MTDKKATSIQHHLPNSWSTYNSESVSQIPELDNSGQICQTQPMRAQQGRCQPKPAQEFCIPPEGLWICSWKRVWPAETWGTLHLQDGHELTSDCPTFQSESTCATLRMTTVTLRLQSTVMMGYLKGKTSQSHSNLWRVLATLRHSCWDCWAGWPTIHSWEKWEGWLHHHHRLSSLPSGLSSLRSPLSTAPWVRVLEPQTRPPSGATKAHIAPSFGD